MLADCMGGADASPLLTMRTVSNNNNHHSVRWLMNIAERSGRLARWRLRISEFDYDIGYVERPKNALADCMSRIPTDVATTVTIEKDISCFIAEPKIPDDSFGDEEPVPVETCSIDSKIPLKLPEDITPAAITHDELARDQNSEFFCRHVLLALENGRNPT